MKPVILVLGPARDALSGVSTHVNLLFASGLAERHALVHFQVGREGRRESAPERWLRFVVSPFLLLAAILRVDASIVHINTSLNPRAYWRDLAYLVVAKLAGCRVLYQVHGGALPENFFTGRPALTRFLRMTLGWPDLVVLLAQCELEAYRRFVPRQALALLPNGVDVVPFQQVERAPRDEALRLAYLGRIADGKGLTESLAALKLARVHGLDVRLSIAGEGPQKAALQEECRRQGLDDDVVFIGSVWGEAKVRLLADSDVLVLTSDSEGLPYALLEGMAAGLPAIATRVGAIPDVIQDGVNGILVPRQDAVAIFHAIDRFANDRDLLEAMSRAAAARVAQHYALPRLARDFAHAYAALALPRPGAAPLSTTGEGH